VSRRSTNIKGRTELRLSGWLIFKYRAFLDGMKTPG